MDGEQQVRETEDEEIGEKGIFENAQLQKISLSVCEAWVCPWQARFGP